MEAAAAAGEWIAPADRAAWLPRALDVWGDRPAGPVRFGARESAELDELLEQQAAASSHLVRSELVDALAWGDMVSAVEAAGYRGRLPGDWSAPASAPSGLVSVPTTQKRCAPTSFGRLAASAQARAALRAFPLDQSARRVTSLRMQVGVAARLHCAGLDEAEWDCIMVTLTYRGTNESWEPSHVRAFMDHVRKWCKRRGWECNYVWVAELQKRGVIHYHVALWVPKGIKLPKPDECGWWPHGMTRIEVARAAVPYLLKYLSKDTSKSAGKFPKGARVYGIGGLSHTERRTRRWLGLPGFVQARSDIYDKWSRAVGGGWQGPAPADGIGPLQVLPSEFRMVRVDGVRCLQRVHTHEREWAPDGPFSWLHRGQPSRSMQ